MTKRYVFDIESLKLADEVGGWINKHKMGIACIFVIDFDTGKKFLFSDDYEEAIPLERFHDFIKDNILIGHNILSFDWRLVQELFKEKNQSMNINVGLVDTKLQLASLASITEPTLGTKKLMEGIMAPINWRNGKKDEVIKYCFDDVQKVVDILKFGLKNEYVLCKAKTGVVRKISIDVNGMLKVIPILNSPICYGHYCIVKKKWQCARCVFKGDCKEDTDGC